MSNERLASIIGLVLSGGYSLIMIATAGTAATYAWVILVAAIALMATSARHAIAEKGQGPTPSKESS